MDYDNTNQFVLFLNKKKETEKHPDYTGKVTLEGGKELRLAAWLRESKNGNKFLSGKISEFTKEQSAGSEIQSNDGLPF